MALPYISNKEGSVSVAPETKTRKSDKVRLDPVELACEELMQAIEKKNIKLMAACLKSIFAICDYKPHVEGPHIKKGK